MTAQQVEAAQAHVGAQSFEATFYKVMNQLNKRLIWKEIDNSGFR